MKKWNLYEWSVILFFLLVPCLGILIESAVHTSFTLNYCFKWFVFGMIGLRLFSAGIKQIIKPQFTLQEIFGLADTKAIPIVRELGFANLCVGLLGILSIAQDNFRFPAAIAGGLLFGLDGIWHIVGKTATTKELFATITDLLAAATLLLLAMATRLTYLC